MGTKEFNIVDTLIAKLRSNQIKQYLNQDDVVLDLGCGHQAFLLKTIKGRIKYGIGIDYDVKSKEIPPNIKILNFKFQTRLPFRRNYFDKIFMLAVIEHFKEGEISRLFKEINRVLKPGGKLILTTPTPSSKPLLEFLAFKLHLISKSEIADHKKYYSEDDLNKIARNNGLKMLRHSIFQLGMNSLCVLGKASNLCWS